MELDVYHHFLKTFSDLFMIKDNPNLVEDFTINILLVLGGIRWGYLSEYPIYDENIFSQIWVYLESFLPHTLSYKEIRGKNVLIYLTKNQIIVDRIFADNNRHNALGIILGFPCVGSRWNDQTIDRYGINLYAKMEGRKKLGILAFMCPVETFTISDKEHIFDLVKRYNEFLNNYGYDLILETKMIKGDMTNIYDIKL
jgi:hypothetical protein